mgnify:CR=1 FL=1
MKALDTELKTFNSCRPLLASKCHGDFALIKDNELIGLFSKQYDAIAEGYRRFGNVPFLVKEVLNKGVA